MRTDYEFFQSINNVASLSACKHVLSESRKECHYKLSELARAIFFCDARIQELEGNENE